MSDAQIVAFVHGCLNDYERYMENWVDEAELWQLERYTDYTEGRCITHANDYLLLCILSLVLHRGSIAEQVYAKCHDYSRVLRCVLHNSLRCLCCSFFLSAVDENRFNKSQFDVSENDTRCIEIVSMYDCYIMAIQLAFRVLNSDVVLQDIIAFFGDDLALGIGDTNESKTKGKETMMVYCVICLLSVLTSRNLIVYDLSV